ncbi:sulfurtransferase [Metasolibacillus sp. FSL H7-0170]|uniref:sulfurtransferase n=1 Tax=Metasolibacillus TaxID=2703677 RepID=UPI000D3723CC|nr:sulfurtransferase [Metasolibacillus fluoroglycofenilyticus]
MAKVFVTVDEIKEESRFIDTRFSLTNADEGLQLYKEGHMNGAVYWDLNRDLSDMTSKEGRHPMPKKEQLQSLFERTGLRYEDIIYIYDQGGMPFAARAWYMLKFAGFPNVYIVNGGFSALAEKFEVTTAQKEYAQTTLTLQWQEQMYAAREDVKNIADGKEQATLLDARAANRYRGEHEPLDPVAGHIPTAKNFDWEQVKKGASLAPTEELLAKVKKDEEVVVYCGSGVTASPLFAVLTEAGYEQLRLYVGSYSDWITAYEVETGENK